MPAKKKYVVKTEVAVKLNAPEYKALQAALESARKPTVRQVQAYFDDVIEREIENLLEEHGNGDEGE